MVKSYKVRTYPTLYPWIPVHMEIIREYEKCPNKSEFVRMALEHFAKSGFPGLQSGQPQVLDNLRQTKRVTTEQGKGEVYDDDPLSDL